MLLKASGNNSPIIDGRPVYFVLEGNVNPRDAEERGVFLLRDADYLWSYDPSENYNSYTFLRLLA